MTTPTENFDTTELDAFIAFIMAQPEDREIRHHSWDSCAVGDYIIAKLGVDPETESGPDSDCGRREIPGFNYERQSFTSDDAFTATELYHILNDGGWVPPEPYHTPVCIGSTYGELVDYINDYPEITVPVAGEEEEE